MTPKQDALTQQLLTELKINNRSVEGTHYARSIRIMGADALETEVLAAHERGEEIAKPEVRSQALFDFVREVSVKGEHGYNTMEATRKAATYVLETMQTAYACRGTARAQLYRHAYSHLVDTFFLLEKTENFRMPGKSRVY